METITHSRVQELVMRLPPAKLPLVYEFLIGLASKEVDESSPQLEFALMPREERQRAMAQQADEMLAHYEQSKADRETWQGGEFVDER